MFSDGYGVPEGCGVERTVERETFFAHTISQTEANVRCDSAAKKVLANRTVLAQIMKGCLKEYEGCTVKDIAERYIEGEPEIDVPGVHRDDAGTAKRSGRADSPIEGGNNEDSSQTEGTAYFDVRFNASAPGMDGRSAIRLIINVEAQNRFKLKYPLTKRAVYYCGRLLSSQYGTVFTNSEYQKLRKVYSIWILTNPPKRFRNTITRYSIRPEMLVGHAAEDIESYDLMSVVMICLGEPGAEDYDGLLRFLEVLFRPELPADEKKRIMEEEFDIPMTEAFESEVRDMCNLSEGFMERGIELGLQKGMEKGIEQGIEKGIEQGIEQGIIGIVEILKELGTPKETIVEKLMEKFSLSMAEAREYVA